MKNPGRPAREGIRYMARKRITVGEGEFTGKNNATLQHAIDSLAYEGGGTVRLPPGKYEMEDALHLRSGVNITGSGRETVLTKNPADMIVSKSASSEPIIH